MHRGRFRRRRCGSRRLPERCPRRSCSRTRPTRRRRELRRTPALPVRASAGVRLWPRDVHSRARTGRLGQVGREAAGQPGERGLAVRACDGKRLRDLPGRRPGDRLPVPARRFRQPQRRRRRVPAELQLSPQVNLQKLYPDAPRLRIGSFATFPISNIAPSPSLDQIKAYLANGQAVAFSGLVFETYNNPAIVDGVFYGPERYVPNDGTASCCRLRRHAGTPGKQGALLVQNSYGRNGRRQRREGGRDAVLVVPDVPGLAAVRGGRVPLSILPRPPARC